MYAKVAALLNSKKQKLRELKAQLDEAQVGRTAPETMSPSCLLAPWSTQSTRAETSSLVQEEIQRLRLGGGGTMDEDKGEAQAGPSLQRGRQGRDRAAQVVDSDDEDDVQAQATDDERSDAYPAEY
jgi:hypothetical protein